MNKFILPGIFVALAIGIFFTFTDTQYAKLKELREINKKYESAVEASLELIKKRDQVVTAYNSISETDRERLEKILPNYIDNVRFIIDVRSVLGRRGVVMKDIKANAENLISATSTASLNPAEAEFIDQSDIPKEKKEYEEVAIGFTFSTNYDNFVQILSDLERSLRVMEVSKIVVEPGETSQYEFELEVKTFWLPQS